MCRNEMAAFMDSFYNCWNSAESRTEFESAVSAFDSALLFWETWECAQYCVANKLRTTLGKPQDTFMAIEGIYNYFELLLQLDLIIVSSFGCNYFVVIKNTNLFYSIF